MPEETQQKVEYLYNDMEEESEDDEEDHKGNGNPNPWTDMWEIDHFFFLYTVVGAKQCFAPTTVYLFTPFCNIPHSQNRPAPS